MTMEETTKTPHLTDPELFTLAIPPVGEPEALPRHLSECLACSRALQQWKSAVREAADEEMEPLERRTAAEWESLENRTIEATRRSGGKRGESAWWAVPAAAAALLLAGLLLPSRRPERSMAPRAEKVAVQLSAQDQRDDALLRDVARLSRGEDAESWNGLAPEPGTGEEEQL
jgi:hypothetical protein